MEFLTIKDVAALTGWSLPTVQKVFERPEFPCLDFGKSKLCTAEAFAKWCGERHTKSDYKE